MFIGNSSLIKYFPLSKGQFKESSDLEINEKVGDRTIVDYFEMVIFHCFDVTFVSVLFLMIKI